MHATALSSPVVVLTGASSGIGRAIANALARRGAQVVLAARGREALEAVAAECELAGAATEVVLTDVTDDQAVRALAGSAIRRFGHIDVWINNVGVGAVGRFDEIPIETHRRVIEANLLGHMNGAHVAIAHFRARGRGTLINMVSLGGWLSTPYTAAYTASKFGLRGFGQSLRSELADLPDIHVCDVYPGFVDTPGVSHGANYTAHRLRPFPPLLSPERVAQHVVRLLTHPKPIVVIGSAARAARYTSGLLPELRGRLAKRSIDMALARAAPEPISNGNLFDVSRNHAISGGYRRAATGPWLGLGALGLAGIALYALRRHA
ncbi:MAG: SDR family oxidoreductase [Steroidobacteraceae bacterium]|nr:SDR family oxidoreductase [Steroidobacteraceae bacterium]